MSRLLVITPVRDEVETIAAVAEALATQTRRPDLWVVVDDGSTDGTTDVLRELEDELPFMRAFEAPRPGGEDRADGLAEASEARAFNWALGEVTGPGGFDFIGKLDGDIILAPAHYERLVAEFERDPRLGIAGCYLEQPDRRGVRLSRMPSYHVNGAVKLYRASCFEQIGGIEERLAWDTIDETHARMLGWRTHSFSELRARHLRPSGSGGGILRGRARHGECVWIVGYPVALVAARSLRVAGERPFGLGGLAFAWGYARAALGGRRRIETPGLLEFSRAEQRARLRRGARRAIGGARG